MDKLKELWNAEYITIRINRRILVLLGLVYLLLWAKDYCYYKGAEAAFKFDLQKGEEKKHEKDDDQTYDSGKLDHSQDNPKI